MMPPIMRQRNPAAPYKVWSRFLTGQMPFLMPHQQRQVSN